MYSKETVLLFFWSFDASMEKEFILCLHFYVFINVTQEMCDGVDGIENHLQSCEAGYWGHHAGYVDNSKS